MNLRFFAPSAAVALGTALLVVPAAQSWAAAPQAAQQSPFGGTIVQEIIARVNEQIISRADYERSVQQLEADARQQGIPPQEVEARKKDLLRDLIDQQLLLSKGKELNINGENELIRQLDEIRKQNHMSTLEDLEKAAKEQGVSYEDFKANIRNRIITQTVVREEVGRRIQMTPGEERRYFDAHKAEFTEPETVRLSEILFSTTPAPIPGSKEAPAEDPAKLAAAKAKSDEVYAKLQAGGKFDELARANSDGPTAPQGGDLGVFRRGQLAKLLEDKTFGLKEGEFTAPIRTKQGYIILKVMQHKQGGVPKMEDVEQQVQEAMYMDRIQPALREYLTKLREEAYIDIKPGYLDSGASPHQTKPVYSAYTPPAPKKKKKVERTRFREKPHSAAVVRTSATSAPAAEPAADTKTSAPAVPAVKQASQKPGKREKVRFGQAPRETLPSAPETKHEDAGALTPEQQQQTATTEPEPENPLEHQNAPKKKTRFSERARVEKPKQAKTPKELKKDPMAPAPQSAEEIAAQQTQAAPLGLAGDTASKKKKKKGTGVPGQKTRITDSDKKKDATEPQSSTPAPAPAPEASQPPAQQ